MNLFLALLARLTTDYGAIVKAVGRGIQAESLDDPRYQDILRFIFEYAKQRKEAPGKELVEGKFGVVMEDVSVPTDVLLQEVLEAQAISQLHHELSLMGRVLTQSPAEVREHLRKMLRIMDDAAGKKDETATYGQLLKKVAEKHDRVKDGARGVPLPWPTLQELTYGLWPDDILIFAARSGVGKSWVLLMCLLHAWKKGHRCLVLTTEMGQLKLAARMAAIDLKLPPRSIRKGRLTDEQRAMLDVRIEELAEDRDLLVAGGKLLFSVELLRQLILETKPALVVIDGGYMLRTGAKGSNKSRAEKTADALEELKAVQLEVAVPFIVSTQFNKNAKKGDEETSEDTNIAQSDVTNWIASYTYAVVQSKEDKEQKRMKFKDLKARDDEALAFQTWWDLDNMQFGEVAMAGGPLASEPPSDDGYAPF